MPVPFVQARVSGPVVAPVVQAGSQSFVARLFITLVVLLVLMAGVIMAVARESLQSNARELVAARRVKELAVTSLALLLTQDGITKEMLLDPTRMGSAVQKIEAYDQGNMVLAQLDSLAASPKVHQTVARLRSIEEQRLRPLDSHVLELMAAGKSAEAKNAYFNAYQPVRAEYEQLLRTLGSIAERDAALAAQRMVAANLRAFANISLSLLVGVVLVLGCVYYAGRRVRGRLEAAIDVLGAVARGDLTRRLPVSGRDEIGRMAGSINQMSGDLQAVIVGIKDTSDRLVTSSAEIAATASESSHAVAELNGSIDQIASGARAQAESTAETVQVMTDMSAQLEEVASRAAKMAIAGDATQQIATRGGETVALAMRELDSVRQTFLRTTDKVRQLEAFSQKIGASTQFMRQVADQTNLLSLNAAIEAARAGEHGRGFAVVANEVRTLAESSTVAADEIADVVQAIQSGIDTALRAIELGTREVDAGAALTTRAQQALTEILTAVDGINVQVKAVASSADEMTLSVTRATTLVSAVAGVSENSAASAEEMAAQSMQVASGIQHLASLSNEPERSDRADGHVEPVRALSTIASELRLAVGSFTV